ITPAVANNFLRFMASGQDASHARPVPPFGLVHAYRAISLTWAPTYHRQFRRSVPMTYRTVGRQLTKGHEDTKTSISPSPVATGVPGPPSGAGCASPISG